MSLRIPVKFLSIGSLYNEFIIDHQGKAHQQIIGGPCLYAAGVMSFWGGHVGVSGIIGPDFPEGWKSKVNAHKVDCRGILQSDDFLDCRKFYAYPAPPVSKLENPVAFYASRGLSFPRELLGYSEELSEINWLHSSQFTTRLMENLPLDYMDATAAHLSPLDLTSHVQLTTRLFKGAIRTLSVQSHPSYMVSSRWDDIHLVVKDLTAFITTVGELQNLFLGRTQDIWDMMKGISGLGCTFVLVRNPGKNWLFYDSLRSTRYTIPDYPARLVDPTGYADAFSGGFLLHYVESHDPLHAAIMAAVAVSLKVERTGPFAIHDCLPGLDRSRYEAIRQTIVRN